MKLSKNIFLISPYMAEVIIRGYDPKCLILVSGHGACHDGPCAARLAVRAAALGPARVQEAPVSCAAGEGNDPTGRLRAVVGFEPEGASPPPPMPSCWWEGADARRRAFEPLNYYSTKSSAQAASIRKLWSNRRLRMLIFDSYLSEQN